MMSGVDGYGRYNFCCAFHRGAVEMEKFRAAVRRLSTEFDVEKGDTLLEDDALREAAKEEKQQSAGPLSSLLGDACRLTGFSYAEVWIRKVESDFVADANELNRAGRRLLPGEIEMKPIDESVRASVEQSTTNNKAGQTRRPFRGNSFELGDIPPPMDENQAPQKSFKLQKAISYDGGGPPAEGVFERTRSNFGKSFKDLKKQLSPEVTFAATRPSADLSASLTFSGISFFNRKKFARDQQLCSELTALISDMQAHYSDHRQSIGQGIAGQAWSRSPSVHIQDLSSFHFDNPEQDKRVHEDQHTNKVAEMFDFSYGVPVLDSVTQRDVVAVMVLYHLKGEPVTRADLEVPAIHDVLLHLSGMVWMAWELERMLPDFNRAAESVNTKRLLEHRTQAVAEPVALTWDKYRAKFGGVPGAKPQAGNDAKFSLFAAAGSFIAILSVTGTDDYFKANITFRNKEMFALVGSFGAVAALLFAAPQSPVSQPRNVIFGHILCCVIAIVVDYFTSPHYFPLFPQWFANALAPALGIAAMSYTGWTHPPAAACATVYISGDEAVKNLHWLYILFPVLFDCFIMIALAVSINNIIPSRQYPTLW